MEVGWDTYKQKRGADLCCSFHNVRLSHAQTIETSNAESPT